MERKVKTIEFPLPDDEVNAKRATQFFNSYDCQMMVGPWETPFYLGEAAPQACRFCKQSAPQVTFKKLAHVMPDFMGNRHILSYFECDSCNQLFGRYEASFANYLGLERTLSQIQGKNGNVPTFIDRAGGLTVSVDETGLHIQSTSQKTDLVLDKAARTGELTVTKSGYVPIHILKLLLKIGFCLLPDEELADYEKLRRFLITDTADELVKGWQALTVFTHYLPGPPLFDAPFAQLYRRRPEAPETQVDKVFLLYYAGYYMQVAMPLSSAEHERLAAITPPIKTFDVPIFPVLTSQERQNRYAPAVSSKHDFTSAKKVKGAKQRYTLQFEHLLPLPPEQETPLDPASPSPEA